MILNPSGEDWFRSDFRDKVYRSIVGDGASHHPKLQGSAPDWSPGRCCGVQRKKSEGKSRLELRERSIPKSAKKLPKNFQIADLY